MSDTLYLKQMELGPMQNFVYLIGDPVTRECVVVDPAWEIDAIVEQAAARRHAARRRARHAHPSGPRGRPSLRLDIPGVEELLARVPAKVYVHKAEREFLRASGRTWSRWRAATPWRWAA